MIARNTLPLLLKVGVTHRVEQGGGGGLLGAILLQLLGSLARVTPPFLPGLKLWCRFNLVNQPALEWQATLCDKKIACK